jgi:NitT/TauT family transport system permease protein
MSSSAGATLRRAGRRGHFGDRAARIAPPLVVLLLLLLLWEWAGQSGVIPRPLSMPSAIGAAYGERGETLLRSGWNTLLEALGGLIIGTALGLIIAFAAARFVIARDILLPLAIGAAAIPLVALAPIFNNWFGIANPLSKMSMSAVLVFFPIFISTTRGLVEVSPGALELMRSYAASDTEVLRKVRIPNMLPFFFTALKVGTTLAFIGAIVAEYFGGTSDVIGRVVITAMFAGGFGVGWAGILLGALAAIVAYLIVSAVERWAIPWYVSLREGEV